MGISKTLGGDRLGSGSGMKVRLHNYERSTFNLSKVWRSTATPGVLIPFYNQLALNGDTFDIDLTAMIRTVPTQGALFGSYKLQMDVFSVPIRLYNGLLHNNALNIGMDMAKVKLPTIELPQRFDQISVKDGLYVKKCKKWSDTCLSAFLGVRGLAGYMYETKTGGSKVYKASVNALPYLAYYDIFKQYYANKQEENAFCIQNYYAQPKFVGWIVTDETGEKVFGVVKAKPSVNYSRIKVPSLAILNAKYFKTCRVYSSNGSDFITNVKGNKQYITWMAADINPVDFVTVDSEAGWDTYSKIQNQTEDIKTAVESLGGDFVLKPAVTFKVTNTVTNDVTISFENVEIDETFAGLILDMSAFPLENIDNMRRKILQLTDFNAAVHIDQTAEMPYSMNTMATGTLDVSNSGEWNGLCLKTYQSDLYNNWLSSDWIEQISNLSKVSTVGNTFSMDSLNLAKKIYDMLNRIAVSGGTYEDWQEAVYGEEAIRRAESPIYCGGASGEIIFDEVISNAATAEQPLGTIAGRGNLSGFRNGKVVIKCEEPSIIMGIVSITPRIDYAQNTNWYMMQLKTLNDLHKPGLDGIGYQDLIIGNATYENDLLVERGDGYVVQRQTAGKQPAWINYQTDVNEVHGNFCDTDKEGWMVLKRDYETKCDENGVVETDFTSYIDPRKFNYPFAYTELDAQNFWLQIGIGVTARRKMSAKPIPNV